MAPGLLVLCVFALAAFKIYDLDFWLHLKAGQQVAATCTVPRVDVYAAPTTGRPWVYHEWLAALGFHGAVKAFGFAGFTVVKALWVASMAWLLYLVARRRGAAPWLAATVVVLACVAARYRLNDRPHLVEYMAVALFLYVLERARAGEWRWLALLAPIQIVWVNSHGSFLLGPVVLAMALAAAAAAAWAPTAWRVRLDDGDAARKRWLAVALLAVVAAVLVNPYGARMLGFAFHVEGMSAAKGVITEWQPSSAVDWLSLRGLIVVGFLLAGVALACRRAVPLFDWMLGVFVVLLATRAIRFQALAALVLAPLLAGHVGRLFAPRSGWWRVGGRRGRIGAAVAVGAMLAVTTHAVATNRHFRPGLGVDHPIYPSPAASFVAQLTVPGTVATPYVWGDYFIWRIGPARKVLLDGRAEIYDQRELVQLLAERSPEVWRQAVEKYDVHVLVTFRPPSAEDEAALAAGRWHLAFYDDISEVWLRDTAAAAQDLERHRLRALRATHAHGGVEPEGAAACDELRRLVAASARHAATASQLGRCLHGLGPDRRGEAMVALRASLRVRADAGVASDLALMLQEAGHVAEADQTFLRARRLDPGRAEPAYNHANLLWEQGRHAEARAAYRQFLRVAPAALASERRAAEARLAGEGGR